MSWSVETYGKEVDDEIEALPADMRLRLLVLLDLIVAQGLGGLPPKSVKHLEDKLWELRFRGRDGIARAIYLTLAGRRVAVVRVFVKKTQQTPPAELKLARQRAKSFVRRHGSN